MSNSYTAIALLECGHWFREHRPAKLAKPTQGELRACGHPKHYPNQYPATYVTEVRETEECTQTTAADPDEVLSKLWFQAIDAATSKDFRYGDGELNEEVYLRYQRNAIATARAELGLGSDDAPDRVTEGDDL